MNATVMHDRGRGHSTRRRECRVATVNIRPATVLGARQQARDFMAMELVPIGHPVPGYDHRKLSQWRRDGAWLADLFEYVVRQPDKAMLLASCVLAFAKRARGVESRCLSVAITHRVHADAHEDIARDALHAADMDTASLYGYRDALLADIAAAKETLLSVEHEIAERTGK